MKVRLLASVLLLALALEACGSSSSRATTTTTAPATAPTTVQPTGTTSPATAVGASRPCAGATPKQITHVVLLVMENRGADEVEGSPSAPYLNRLGAECGLATDYRGISHPSLPNYIALTSGSTYGISDDNDPSSHPLSEPSIFSLLGTGWRSLEESMPSSCDRSAAGDYAPKHNPAAYYTNLGAECAAQDVALTSPPDLSARFTLITPNLCHDMHNCSTSVGDTWLSSELPQILGSPQYLAGSTAVFITWDENDSGGSLVPTYVVSPSVVAGTRSAESFSHYSLLRTTEELLGVSPMLGGAATATSMSQAFHLG